MTPLTESVSRALLQVYELLGHEEVMRRAKAEAERMEAERLAQREGWAAEALANGPGAFAAFVKWAWPIVEPAAPLIWGWHLNVVCEELQMVLDGATDRLVICIPPGMAKSLVAAVMLPAFDWLHRPHRRAMYVSVADKVVNRDASRCRDIVLDPEYQALAAQAAANRGEGPWSLKQGDKERLSFRTTKHGWRGGFVRGGKLTGERGNLQVVDDPVDVDEVLKGDPERIADRMADAWEWMEKKLSTRLNAGQHNARVLIMQRLHPADPAGMAILDGWRVVTLPMRFDPDMPKALGGVHPKDPRTTPGELLCPALMSPKKVRRLARSLGIHASAQLDQRPVLAEGGRIKRSWFTIRYHTNPEEMAKGCDEVSITVDAAQKGGSGNDLHAIHCWGRRSARKILLGRKTERFSYLEFEQALDAFIIEWWPHVRRTGGIVYIEDTANGAQYLAARKHGIPIGPEVNGYQPRMVVPLIDFSPQRDTPGRDKGKGARATYLVTACEAMQVDLPAASVLPGVEAMLDCWCAFPSGANDDDVDTASQLFMRWALATETIQEARWGWGRDRMTAARR